MHFIFDLRILLTILHCFQNQIPYIILSIILVTVTIGTLCLMASCWKRCFSAGVASREHLPQVHRPHFPGFQSPRMKTKCVSAGKPIQPFVVIVQPNGEACIATISIKTDKSIQVVESELESMPVRQSPPHTIGILDSSNESIDSSWRAESNSGSLHCWVEGNKAS